MCYCHSPMRFAWNYHDYMAGESVPRRAHIVLSLILNYVRLWDEVTANRVDAFIANSRVVARRIRKRYGRMSTIINPNAVRERRSSLAAEWRVMPLRSRLCQYASM